MRPLADLKFVLGRLERESIASAARLVQDASTLPYVGSDIKDIDDP